MANDWEVVSLAEHCTKIGSGATPRGGSSVYLEEGEITLIRSQNIYNDGFKRDGLVFITKEAAEKLKNVVVEENDILLNITGDSVARVCMVDNQVLPARVNQHVAIIRPKESSFNSLYLRYQLVSPQIQQLLLNYASAGATRNALTKSMIEGLGIPKPDLDTQNNIAHILGSLDEKIELNRQMNETLEAMAQALFKSWFVDFDPVIDNALAAGNAIPDELLARAEQRKAIKKKDNSDIQGLFPGEFEFTEEMGWIPKEWASDTVKELANVTDYVANGSFASLKENVTLSDDPEYALYIRTTDYKNDFSLAKAKYVNEHSYDFLKKSVLEGYEVIISNVGDTGTVFRPPVWLNQPMTLGSNAIAIKNEDMSNFLQYYFSSYFGQYQISSIVGGSAQPKFNKTDFRALAVYFGSLELVSKFEEACQPLRAKIDTNLSQILLLSNIRDTLLPQLMSGELRIADAEVLVENV